MLRRLLLFFAALAILMAAGCVARSAYAQDPHRSPESKAAAKAAEAQRDPKPYAARGDGVSAPASETGKADRDEGEEAEGALKQSAMVKKFGSILGIKDAATAYWIFTIVNFGILALALGAAARKILPAAFRGRSASIQRSLEEARKASREANLRLSQIQDRLSQIDSQIASMQATAEEQGRAEEQRLRSATEEEQAKILRAAEQEIAAISASAQRELKQFAAELAISLAQKNISVDEATDRELVRDFAQGLTNGDRGSGV